MFANISFAAVQRGGTPKKRARNNSPRKLVRTYPGLGESPDSSYQGSAWLAAMPRGPMDQPSPSSRPGPSFAELFTPKLVTVFREGYGLADLRADAIAGLTVAIVALPLSMAIAIASGVAPERG